MALISDATSLVALGEMQWIHLLRHLDPEVVISPEVQREVRRFQPQITDAENNGWLRVEKPSISEVDQLRRVVYGLHQGEAEAIILIGRYRRVRTKLLMDEGFAFEYVRAAILPRCPLLEQVCLAQVLHHLEESGHLPITASEAMGHLIDNGSYSWAAEVRRYYMAWCKQHGKTPLPQRPGRSSSG